jgi:hypothetical protein
LCARLYRSSEVKIFKDLKKISGVVSAFMCTTKLRDEEFAEENKQRSRPLRNLKFFQGWEESVQAQEEAITTVRWGWRKEIWVVGFPRPVGSRRSA